jgi:hypothetical protein
MRYRELVTAEETYLKANGWTRRRMGRSNAVHWIPPRTMAPEADMLLAHDSALEWQKKIDRAAGGKD